MSATRWKKSDVFTVKTADKPDVNRGNGGVLGIVGTVLGVCKELFKVGLSCALGPMLLDFLRP